MGEQMEKFKEIKRFGLKMSAKEARQAKIAEYKLQKYKRRAGDEDSEPANESVQKSDDLSAMIENTKNDFDEKSTKSETVEDDDFKTQSTFDQMTKAHKMMMFMELGRRSSSEYNLNREMTFPTMDMLYYGTSFPRH